MPVLTFDVESSSRVAGDILTEYFRTSIYYHVGYRSFVDETTWQASENIPYFPKSAFAKRNSSFELLLKFVRESPCPLRLW